MNKVVGDNRIVLDHIRYGKTIRYFVYPQSFKQDISGFEDTLREIIPPKLQLLLERSLSLKTEKDLKLRIISEKFKEGSFDEYFNTSIVMYEFAEYYVIQKWLNYWLNLWYKVNPKELPPQVRKRLDSLLDERDIENAKQSPIQDYYEGRLRQVGSRFTGVCCFHEEKTPSFFIFPDNHWHCFGACSTGGDAINFIMKLKKLTFPEAVRYLL